MDRFEAFGYYATYYNEETAWNLESLECTDFRNVIVGYLEMTFDLPAVEGTLDD